MQKTIASASKLLRTKGISQKAITPSSLVSASNQLNQSLESTLNLIAFLKSGGQGFSAFPQTAKVLTGEYS